MAFALRVLSPFLLLFVACYTPVPVVSTPQQLPETQKTPPPAETKRDTVAAPAAPREVVANLSFTESFSWTLSGHTPSAAWSPSRSQLVFFSEYEKGPKNKNKKYVEVVDLKTGEISMVTTVIGGVAPVWVDEESLL
jgi:hypothetical protein